MIYKGRIRNILKKPYVGRHRDITSGGILRAEEGELIARIFGETHTARHGKE